MNTIQTSSGWGNVLADCGSTLGYLACWLDPDGFDDSDEIYDEWDEWEWGNYNAKQITRRHDLELYSRINWNLDQQEHKYDDAIDRTISDEFESRFHYGWLDELYQLNFGFIFSYHGTNFSDYYGDEFWQNSRFAEFVYLIGGHPDKGHQNHHAPADTARVLRQSLESIETPTAMELAMMLRFIFNDTGNSSLDYSYEEAEFSPMDAVSEMDFGIAIQIEADDFIDVACCAAKKLETNDELYQDFAQNALIAYMYIIQKEHHDHRTENPTFHWPSITGQKVTKQTSDDAERVAVGDDIAA